MEAVELLELIENGEIWVKNGADKRKVISKVELSRLLQSSGNLYAEEMIVQHSTVDDIDWYSFQLFYEGKYKEQSVREDIPKPFNSLGKLEIPEIVITELLVNALVHRDYFIQDSIKLFVFDDRIEIISPGKLPNSLTEEQIKRGVRRSRNSIICSLAPDLLEYRGAGSGIMRALQAYPDIDFFNDVEGEQFKVTVRRKTEM